MSLRRSARARISAVDEDVVTAGEKRKRKRSTMTPETSQSPAKAGSPVEDLLKEGASSSSPSNGRPARKIIVKSSRKSLPEVEQPTAIPLADLKTEDAADSDEELQELSISDEDRKKLLTVLQVYAPDLLTQKAAHRKGEQITTLQHLLSTSSCNIRTIRNHILALRNPLVTASSLRSHLSSSHISPPTKEIEEDQKRLSAMTMALAIVDEVAARSRNQIEDITPTDSEKAKKRADDYALHMRLPSGDYFTNAVRLPVKEAIRLDTGYSKLVSVATQPLSLDNRPPPTLKDRLPRMKPPKTMITSDGIEEEIIKPVSHLYYNPWSSFAPTYDSFDGNINFKASKALWRSRKADKELLGQMAEEPVSRREALEEMLDDLEDVDTDAVLEIYDELKQPVTLQSNAALLRQLDELQSQRWKRTFARRLLNRATLLEEPSEEEKRVAGEIMDTLSQLLAQQSGSLSHLVPSKESMQAASASACIDPALVDGEGEPGYWGSLNENFYGPSATRRVTGARMAPVRPPAAIRDNETIRMEPAMEEKASAAMAQMGTMQKGKGMLDRFASERQYTLVDHPHDRKLAVSATPSMSAPIPQSIPPQQHPHSHSHQMSPQGGVGANVRPNMNASRPSMQYMSPPASTPPARPFHHPQMRPSLSINSYQQQQQQQKMGMYRSPGGAPPQQQQQQQRSTWPHASPQQYPANNYYPAKPFAPDHRFVSGSPT